MLEVAQDGTGSIRPASEDDVGPSGTAHVLATGRPHGVSDARAGGVRAEPFDSASALFLPLAWGGEVRQVAIALWHVPRQLGPAEEALGEVLADVAAAGFARLQAEERRGAGSVQDRAVVRAARALNASLDLQEVLRTLAREAALALQADVSGVYLGDAEHGAVATAGHGTAPEWQGLHVAPGEGAAGHVLATGTPFVSSDCRRDLKLLAHPFMRRYRSVVAVPMAWNEQLKGALTLAWLTHRHVGEEDLRTLEAIAGLATLACRNAEAYEQVQQAARTDALTGLLNHGAMQVRIREEIARAERDGAPLACVIIDLDDFKRVNDSHGHQAGDDLLRGVADLLRRELRPYDQVARYGGDEFVLLLPGSDEAHASQVAERVRHAMESTAAQDGSHLGLAGACSLGVAAWEKGLSADALLENADRALMLAKRTGKGRVAIANAQVELELALLHSQQGSPAAVQALAAAIEERDNRTHMHSEQVVRLARGVAMLLGLGSDQVERIAHAALLHDVGKLAIPAEILHKAGPLTHAEWIVMAEHPIVGERILMRTPDLAPIAPIVRHEHEHWDGSGYPDGLDGRRIPLGSRIILACDAYVAMTAERPYRPARGDEEAIAELRRGARAQFDPEIVDALLDLLGQNRPDVPDRARGVKLRPPPPEAPSSRRSAPDA